MAFDSVPARDLPLSDTAMDQLFTGARTRNAWTDRPVSDDLIRRLYDLTKFGPTAFNASLQGGYFLLAARALGLDVGPMSGFDAEGVKAEFLGGTAVEPNFVVNLGYGSDENLFPRSPRLSFDEAAEIL